MMLPVAGLGSFLSNTTAVAMLVGIVKMWSKKSGIAPSKLFIPLSCAAGMGGVCSLIGTPPNRRWLEYAIIHSMNPIATDNYDFERLIADGYAYVEP